MRSVGQLSEIVTEITRLESRMAALRTEEQSVRQNLEQVRNLFSYDKVGGKYNVYA